VFTRESESARGL